MIAAREDFDMEPRKSRRRFLGLAGASATSALLLSTATGRADDPPKKDKTEKKTYQGTSKKADIIEALGMAIQAAHKATPGADILIQWTLKGISGRDGGIAGFTEVTVAIEV
jgi:hypothetical protein